MPAEYYSASPIARDAAQHHLFDYRPPARFGFRRDDEPPLGPEALDRIIRFYERMRDDFSGHQAAPDMWNAIVGAHDVLIRALEARDHAALTSLFQTMGMTPLVRGFGTYISSPTLELNARARDWEAAQLVDKLLSLLESRQLAPVLNPEQGPWVVRQVDLDRALEAAFTVDGRRIAPPRAGGGLFGLHGAQGVYSLKDPKSLYTALRAEHLLSLARRSDGVCEIGGGLGVLAYYSQQLSRKRYRLFDLPTVSILQAYFLMRSLGEDAVWLWGEPEAATQGVELCPYWVLYDYAEPVSVFINQDSFPEINAVDARRYMASIARCRPTYFLSINQEARAPDGVGGRQLRVGDLISDQPDLVLLSRARDWLRKGWVEELYMHRNPA